MGNKGERLDVRRMLTEKSDLADLLRGEQLDAVFNFTPLVMLFHVAVGGFLIYLFQSSTSPLFLLSWTVAFLFVIASNLDAWRRNRKQSDDRQTILGVQTAIINATALSLVWGFAMIVLFPVADAKQKMALAIIIISMMSLGAVRLATIRQAALSYIVVFTICIICAAILTNDRFFVALSGLQGVLALAVTVAVIHHSFLFAERMISRAKLTRQAGEMEELHTDLSQTLGLSKFESDGDGVLIKIDRQFARSIGKSASELVKVPLADLLVDEPRLADHPDFVSAQEMDDLLAGANSFREKLVALEGEEGRVYWRISASLGREYDGAYGKRGYCRCAQKEVNQILALKASPLNDAVTGLQNRMAFEQKIQKLLNKNKTNPTPFACITIMVRQIEDDTKSVNETIMRTLADRLKAAMTGHGIVCHSGAGQFGVLCPMRDGGAALRGLLEGMSALSTQMVTLADGDNIQPVVKIGAVTAPVSGDTPHDIMSKSEAACGDVDDNADRRWHIKKHTSDQSAEKISA